MIDDVVTLTGRTRSTITGYLADFIVTERPRTIDRWIDREHYDAITPVAARLGTERLKPIYDEFEGRLSYDTIRVVVAHVVAQTASQSP
ncbi:MAG TPA: helix-turn-helix domain-containing protein [Thermoanaerobaculia bacterium]|nr:helix-turn-helix domain-containing protein [Thermoanaerobaculia bacterium]